jgi:hypothetical protein
MFSVSLAIQHGLILVFAIYLIVFSRPMLMKQVAAGKLTQEKADVRLRIMVAIGRILVGITIIRLLLMAVK